jgi:hypothetical protein
MSLHAYYCSSPRSEQSFRENKPYDAQPYIRADLPRKAATGRSIPTLGIIKMSRKALLALLWTLSLPCHAQDPIPPHLVGVWATDDSVVREQALVRGMALYLDSNGWGGFVGGPPPIGYLVKAKFSADTNTIAFDGLDFDGKGNGKVMVKGIMSYDADLKVIRVTDGKGSTLRRRFDELTNSTRKLMGIPLRSQ